MRSREEIELLVEFMQDDTPSPYANKMVSVKDCSRSLVDALLWTTGIPVERLDDMVARRRRDKAVRN